VISKHNKRKIVRVKQVKYTPGKSPEKAAGNMG